MNNVEVIKPYEIILGQAYKFYTGTIYRTNEGYEIKVIEYIDKYNVVVEFLYNGYRKTARMSNIVRGSVKNPFHPNKYGGYLGIGPISTKTYEVWMSILKRVSIQNHIKDSSRYQSYSKTTICIEWLNYQNFAYWYNNYIKDLNPNFKYEIDKDILQWNQEYKIYSPQTCCLVPHNINITLAEFHVVRKTDNSLPLGVYKHGNGYRSQVSIAGNDIRSLTMNDPMEAFEFYKEIKIQYIRELSNYLLSLNAIKEDIYNILISLKINPYKEYEN